MVRVKELEGVEGVVVVVDQDQKSLPIFLDQFGHTALYTSPHPEISNLIQSNPVPLIAYSATSVSDGALLLIPTWMLLSHTNHL